MLAEKFSGEKLDDRYIYEVKYDGGRCIAIIKDGNVRLMTRAGNYVEYKLPFIVSSLIEMRKHNCILDGEICHFKDDKSIFNEYLKRINLENPYMIEKRSKSIPLCYCVFDIIELEGKDLTGLTLLERKKILKELIKEDEHLKYVEHTEQKDKLLEFARKNKLEGIMAKIKGSKYDIGKRNPDWIKLKFYKEEDFTIYGYTSKEREISALVLGKEGYFMGKVNFRFTGGLYQKFLKEFEKTQIKNNLFNINLEKGENVFWIEPIYVAKVIFQEKCDNGLRFPILKDIVVM